jgi:pumilio family protein 6
MATEPPKWLLSDEDVLILTEIKEIRKGTSKKDPETRRAELRKQVSPPLLDLIAERAATLVQSSFGCQFVGEVLFGAVGEKDAALRAVAELAKPEKEIDLDTPPAGRMMKALVQGGPFDKMTRSIKPVEPALNLHNVLVDVLGDDFWPVVESWAFGGNAFIVVALLEADGFEHRAELVKRLKKAAKKQRASSKQLQAHAGTRLILEKVGAAAA